MQIRKLAVADCVMIRWWAIPLSIAFELASQFVEACRAVVVGA
jgi:hypothetical protein